MNEDDAAKAHAKAAAVVLSAEDIAFVKELRRIADAEDLKFIRDLKATSDRWRWLGRLAFKVAALASGFVTAAIAFRDQIASLLFGGK